MAARTETQWRTSNKLLFWLGVLVALCGPIAIWKAGGDTGLSALVAACGAFVTVMAKFEAIIELSFGPLKARMAESVMEANATTEQLRDVALTSAKSAITSLMAESFLGSLGFRSRFDMHEQILRQLRETGATEEQIKDADEYWTCGLHIIYSRAIQSQLEEIKKRDGTPRETQEELARLVKDLRDLIDMDLWSVPSPSIFRRIITERGLMTAEIDEWISDYEHFSRTGEIRRLELFLKQ